jgi:hypothetical protein
MAYTTRILVYVILGLPNETTARYAIESTSHRVEWFHIKFHDRFRYSINVKVIASISGAAVLVLLMGGICEICRSDVL